MIKPTTVILILFVLLILFILFSPSRANSDYKEGFCNSKIKGVCRTGSLYNFNRRLPAVKYYDLIREFGEPTMLLDNPGGLVIWKNPDFFEEIVLRDESIEHMRPRPHCDFLYATVNVYVPVEILPAILSLDNSLIYDSLKRELTGRCDSMNSIVAILYLAMKIVNDPELFERILTSYDNFVKSASDKTTYRGLYDELKVMVKENQTTYAEYMANKNCFKPQGNSFAHSL